MEGEESKSPRRASTSKFLSGGLKKSFGVLKKPAVVTGLSFLAGATFAYTLVRLLGKKATGNNQEREKYCDHPNCSKTKVKRLERAHHYLCSKSDLYHNWHHNPHHKKVHVGVAAVSVLVAMALVYNMLPHSARAAVNFTANWDSDLNANGWTEGTARLTGTNDGTPATLTEADQGFGGNGEAVQVASGQTLKYPIANNLDPRKGEVEVKVKSPYAFTGQDYTAKTINAPGGIEVDRSTGTEFLYISDSENDRIIKTNRAGTLMESFGKSGSGTAQFNNPGELCYDSDSGYVFVLDIDNGRIVRTKMDGTGWLEIGKDNIGLAAGLTCDTAGAGTILYMLDTTMKRIVKTDADGNYWYTMTGNGTENFNNAQDISIDPDTDLLYITLYNSVTEQQKIVKTGWGGGGWDSYDPGGYLISNSEIYYDTASDYIYFTDGDNPIIYKAQWDGEPSSFTLTSAPPYATDFKFSSDTLYYLGKPEWATFNTNSIIITGWGSANRENFGNLGRVNESFNNPADMVYDSASGFYYIVDQANHRIVKTKFDGSSWQSVGSYGNGGDWRFYNPYSIHYDAASDYVYVADKGNYRIIKLKMDGSFWQARGAFGTGVGQFSGPSAVYYDALSEYVYVGENTAASNPKKAIKFQWLEPGTWTTSWKSYAFTYNTGDYQFKNISDIYYDSAGGNTDLYILDGTNCRLARMSVDANLTPLSWATPNTGTSCSTGTRYYSYPRNFYIHMPNPGEKANYVFYVAENTAGRISSTKIDGSNWAQSAGSSFANPVAIYFDGSSQVSVLEASFSSKRIKKSLFAGTSATYFDGTNLTKNVFKTDGDYPMWIYTDTRTNRFEVYISLGSVPVKLDTGPLTFDANTWHTIKFTYHQESGTAHLYFGDSGGALTEVDSVDLGALGWTTPTGLGDYFYVGSDPDSPTTKALEGILDDLTITSYEDNEAPPEPALASALVAEGGAPIDSSQWYNNAHPYFSWTEPVDTAEGGNPASGTAGYYVYFGPSNTANPKTTSGVINATGAAQRYITDTNITVAGTIASGPNYFRIIAKDNDGNESAPVTLVPAGGGSSSYQYDVAAPINPTRITASPSGYTRERLFEFFWNAGSDENRSGVAKYQWRIKKANEEFYDEEWQDFTDIADPNNLKVQFEIANNEDEMREFQGTNVFYLRTVDSLGNTSNPIIANFMYAGTAPNAPENLQVTPAGTTSTDGAEENRFSFTWEAPDIPAGGAPIARYRYYFETPSENAPYYTTTNTSLPEDSYATRQVPNANHLYVIAEDTTGNVDYGAFDHEEFYAETPAPEAPKDVSVFDISNREKKQYMIVINWTDLEDDEKGTGFDKYYVYRCVDNKEHTACTENSAFGSEPIGSTPGTTFVDSGDEVVSDENHPYTYLVKARDNANQYSRPSAHTQPIVPTGKYTKAPKLDGDPSVTAKSYSASMTWKTIDNAEEGQTVDANHTAQGFIYYSINKDDLGQTAGAILAEPGYGSTHTIQIPDLQPQTKYWYQLVWKDIDGQTGRTDPAQFETGPRPTISDVKFGNITLNKATVSWKSSLITNSKISYCVKNSNTCGTTDDVSSGASEDHLIQLSDLSHSTTYKVSILGYSEEGKTVKSDDYEFSTLVQPVINGEVLFDQDKEAVSTTYRLSWETNIPTTSVVNYQAEGRALSQAKAEYSTKHDMTIADLADKSSYNFTVTGTDEHGNEVETPFSNVIQTPEDTRPPKIISLTVEIRSSGVGSAQKAQLVVSWETDEPSSSQVEYGPGISSDSYPSKSQEDAALTTNHVVIVSDLEAAKLYHLRALSKDKSGNLGKSSDTTSITGKIQRSVIDVIINSLQRSFGFLNRLSFLGLGE